MMRMLKDRRGSLAFFIVFVFMVIILLILFAFGIPLSIRATTEFYAVGEELISESQQTIANIQNETIRQQLQEALSSAQQSTADQISILTWFFQYSWIWILIVVTLVIYMLARKTVEYGGVR